MAQFDLNVWYCGAANGGSPSGRSGGFDDKIPNGNSTITCIDNNMADAFPCTPGSSHVINVNWQEIAPDGTPTAQRVSITFVP